MTGVSENRDGSGFVMAVKIRDNAVKFRSRSMLWLFYQFSFDSLSLT